MPFAHTNKFKSMTERKGAASVAGSRRRAAIALLSTFVGSLGAGVALADEGTSAYAPNLLWTRPALLDGPGSLKEAMRARGVSIDLWWTQFYQQLSKGDGEKDWQYGGKGDIIANVDISKIFRIWGGLSVNVHQEFLYGEDV
ncbi:MAG: hypothetical protein AAF961_20065, partial [Planctomycetota bacterium]